MSITPRSGICESVDQEGLRGSVGSIYWRGTLFENCKLYRWDGCNNDTLELMIQPGASKVDFKIFVDEAGNKGARIQVRSLKCEKLL